MDLKICFVFSFLCLTKEKNEIISYLPNTMKQFKKENLHSSLPENTIKSDYLSYTDKFYLNTVKEGFPLDTGR